MQQGHKFMNFPKDRNRSYAWRRGQDMEAGGRDMEAVLWK